MESKIEDLTTWAAPQLIRDRANKLLLKFRLDGEISGADSEWLEEMWNEYCR